MDHVDIAIVGGGPVGAALATGLEGSGLSVAILEARVLQNQKLEAPDPRAGPDVSHLSREELLAIVRRGGDGKSIPDPLAWQRAERDWDARLTAFPQ